MKPILHMQKMVQDHMHVQQFRLLKGGSHCVEQWTLAGAGWNHWVEFCPP